ncbi:MAG: hypothetical protein WCE63_08390 [Acidobacteriaceae bacterium]
MKSKQAAWLLLGIQLVLVLSVAGKYWYERKTCPRVWVETAQYDPNMPLRGRYLGLQLTVNACSLPRDKAQFSPGFAYPGGHSLGAWTWNVVLVAQDGHLVPRVVDPEAVPEGVERLTLREKQPCDSAPVAQGTTFYIPDTARGPFPLVKGETLWVEVTVPPSGPPRPIQLAVSSAAGWQPLKFE